MKRKILIIEDDWAMGRTLAHLLDIEGYETEIAFNGQEGLEKIRHGFTPACERWCGVSHGPIGRSRAGHYSCDHHVGTRKSFRNSKTTGSATAVLAQTIGYQVTPHKR